MNEQVATRIIKKYLRKGNMARCLRDVLPSAGLSKNQRDEIATIVHDVVRWRRLYEHIIDKKGLPQTPDTYLHLALTGAQADAKSHPFEYRYSCSSFVAETLKNHVEWAEFLNETPPTTLCVNFNKTTTDTVISLLQQEALPAERSHVPSAVFSSSISKYSNVIHQRLAHVQDESSQLVSFLAASLGGSIFDLCAGNGGKSLSLASLTHNQKQLYAYELNSEKRTTLKRRCMEYSARVLIEDVLPDKHFDVVLVDAPCTGLGAARRNPEAKYIDGVGDLPQRQLSLLRQAASLVRENGILFYAVCTVTPEETTQVIETFLLDQGFTDTCLKPHPYQAYLLKNTYGVFTALPRGDLFFLSVLQKHESDKQKK